MKEYWEEGYRNYLDNGTPEHHIDLLRKLAAKINQYDLVNRRINISGGKRALQNYKGLNLRNKLSRLEGDVRRVLKDKIVPELSDLEIIGKARTIAPSCRFF